MAPPKPLADFIDACLGPALARQGFAASDVIVAWPEIAGERLAAWSRPIKLEWPRRGRPDPDARPEPAALVVRVESAFALEMQHLAPLLVERINAHYGWRCVGRIVLKQGPVPRPKAKPKLPAELPAEDRERLAEKIRGVEAEPLRAALDRLGAAVVGSARRTKA
ncbi:MAG TPA: DciA family protein [Beijerinckiaceae bacterium]|jgi:hypothetical protein